MFLVISDAHSKWIDVLPTSSASVASTVRLRRRVFGTHSVPACIVSDNVGSCTGEVFNESTKTNGIKHNYTSPFHPSSNALAENAVKTFKRRMKKMQDDGDLDTCLARFLFN